MISITQHNDDIQFCSQWIWFLTQATIVKCPKNQRLWFKMPTNQVFHSIGSCNTGTKGVKYIHPLLKYFIYCLIFSLIWCICQTICKKEHPVTMLVWVSPQILLETHTIRRKPGWSPIFTEILLNYIKIEKKLKLSASDLRTMKEIRWWVVENRVIWLILKHQIECFHFFMICYQPPKLLTK